mmetsp:Transcript_20463/g.30510  ORF Transcript_20463/g.30510 Transcript_20463/m.30510 type:complete len:355 (+) Transcript_20463:230-1294(+)
MLTARVIHHTLTQDKRTLLNSNNGSLDHNPVIAHLTIVHKSSHGGNGLLSQISFGHTALLITSLSDAVDLLVLLGTVEVSVLTGTGHSVGHTGRMPRSDTGDLTKTTMGLTRQTTDSPTGGHTLVTTTLGNSNHINVLILGKDTVNGDLLLKEALGEVDLGSCISSVDLDLHNVCLLHAEVAELLRLSVGNDTYKSTEFGDAVQLLLNILGSVLVLLCVLGVGLLLGGEPVLVAATLELLTQVLGEYGGQRAKTAGGLNVTNNSDDDHGRGLNDGNGVHDLALVHESTGAIDSTDYVGHTSLVTTEGGQVARLGGIILGETADTSRMVLGTLARVETQTTVAGCFELTVRHVGE